MSKRSWIIILAVIIVVTNVVQYFLWSKKSTKDREGFEARITELQSQLSKYGSDVSVYTVNGSVNAGQEVTDDTLTPITMPSNYVDQNYITDPTLVVGQYFKIPIRQGTILTFDMFMDYEITEDMRDYDVTLTSWSIGLKPGDYIDVIITLPYGDQYKVLTKKRIMEINGETLKLYLTEAEQEILRGALVDYYLNSEYGATITGDKYIEPGLQTEAVPYYAVPDNIKALMLKDPNIEDKAIATATESWRASIEEALTMFRDEDDTVDSDASKLVSGRSDHYSTVNDQKNEVQDAYNESKEEDQQAEDDFWGESPVDASAAISDSPAPETTDTPDATAAPAE